MSMQRLKSHTMTGSTGRDPIYVDMNVEAVPRIETDTDPALGDEWKGLSHGRKNYSSHLQVIHLTPFCVQSYRQPSQC